MGLDAEIKLLERKLRCAEAKNKTLQADYDRSQERVEEVMRQLGEMNRERDTACKDYIQILGKMDCAMVVIDKFIQNKK